MSEENKKTGEALKRESSHNIKRLRIRRFNKGEPCDNMINPNTRVNQLDATLLDQELFNNLSKQTLSIFNKIAPIYKTQYSNEIDFILRTLLFKFTVWDKNQSYGLFLQNLKFKNLNQVKKLSYYTVFILGYYLSQKLQSFIYNDDDDDELDENRNQSKFKKFVLMLFRKSYINLSKLYKILSFLNFIDFLITGNYQSLNLRLLNIKISIFSIELAKLNKGNISFEFQNRQLIWNTFLEFILFILPIFQKSKFQSQFNRLLNFRNTQPPESSALKYNHLKEKQCAICFENNANKIHDYLITNPYVTNCNHIYCYICLLTKLENAKNFGEQWKCLRCGTKVEYCEPYDNVDKDAIEFKIEEDEFDEKKNENESESESESDDEKKGLQRDDESDEDEDEDEDDEDEDEDDDNDEYDDEMNSADEEFDDFEEL